MGVVECDPLSTLLLTELIDRVVEHRPDSRTE